MRKLKSVDRKNQFFAKTWYIYAAALFCTSFALICAIMGPMIFFEIIKPANRKPGTIPGIILTAMAVPFAMAAVLGWFNIIARWKPLLRICSDGIEINIIGATSLDGVPFIPGYYRVAWAILSLQGFRQQIAWIPWGTFREVDVSGLPMMKTLTINGIIVYPSFRGDEMAATYGEQVTFRDAEFRDPLTTIATNILVYYVDPTLRSGLPSLHD